MTTQPHPKRRVNRLLALAGAACGALALAVVGCGGREDPSPALPITPTNIQIVLSNFEYRDLRNDRGYVKIKGGTYGIIVYRENASTYRAFERLCPYQPQLDCALVSVDGSSLFMRDSCCGTQFNFNGEPIGGPGARPLQQYTTALVGGTLYITN